MVGPLQCSENWKNKNRSVNIFNQLSILLNLLATISSYTNVVGIKLTHKTLDNVWGLCQNQRMYTYPCLTTTNWTTLPEQNFFTSFLSLTHLSFSLMVVTDILFNHVSTIMQPSINTLVVKYAVKCKKGQPLTVGVFGGGVLFWGANDGCCGEGWGCETMLLFWLGLCDEGGHWEGPPLDGGTDWPGEAWFGIPEL